ncbi:MAG: heterodisulfide reductase-related iron-sulfur binding cluster [Coriobacteriia bacterium]|nr:heterodisulfide reductase-related iron-sulfur binding cluster [Coriobacteriia bacterium]
MKEFAVFWGCTIPARFPFIEKSTRVVFEDLGATVHELNGHTCCPEGTLVKANDEQAFYTAAARNLAIVEKAGLDVVTPCNGCYSTFKEASSHLKKDWREREAINERLATEDLHYDGNLKITHFAEWLVDEMGPGLIASKAVKPLWGMRIAVHYGCHLLRPQPAVRWDDPLHPTKVEALVAALGARVVDYPTKMQCCGGALDRVGERDSSLAFARRKLMDVTREGVDALVVVCPSCFQQFDLNQAALQRANEDVHVPVLYLSELIALAYGHEPDEIGLSMHRVSVDPFLERWGDRQVDKERLGTFFDVSLLGKCASCQACKDDCPVCKVDTSFQPTEIIEQLVRGHLDDVIADSQLWKCLECYTCQELCHSEIGMAETFRKLKELAMAAGTGPESVSAAYDQFLSSGVLGKPKEGARKKLGLSPLPASGGDAVAKLLSDRTDEGEQS